MAARGGSLARAAWTALVVLFAARAAAGTVLCDLYGEHPVPPSAIVSSQAQRDATHAAATQGHHADDRRPANDRSDHACDDPVYLTGASVSAPTIKPLSVHDAAACTHLILAAPPPPVAAAVAWRQQHAHPPRPTSPLDVSRRLRI